MSKPVIEVRGLAKQFKGVNAVAGIDFSVKQGELFGFLGPNGAGKTTTVRILTGVLSPSQGTASIRGHDIRSQSLLSRAHIAVVPEQANVYLDLSVRRNIILMAELYGIPREQAIRKMDELLGMLELGDRAGHRARELSKGLRQRLMLCAALITEPEILFLDEPTSGLDVQGRHMIQKIIKELNGSGLTIFLTTHDMDEAGQLCSRIAIINKGRIAAIDTPERLRSAIISSQFVDILFEDEVPDKENFESLAGVSAVETGGCRIRLFSNSPSRTVTEAACLIRDRNLKIQGLCTKKPSLEQVFLYFTDHSGREEK